MLIYEKEAKKSIIETLFIALSCNDSSCEVRREEIDEYFQQLMSVCIFAADLVIPKVKSGQKASWSKHVGLIKGLAKFWHKLWMENGCPGSGTTKEIMVKTRSEYKRKSQVGGRQSDKLVF